MTRYRGRHRGPSKDELQGARPDPNPSIKCPDCGQRYKFDDYWAERYVSDKSWNPREVRWICDECLEEMYEWYERRRRGREHKQLTEWSE